MPKQDEQVMVVPSWTIDTDFSGFSRDPKHMPSMDLAEFRPRAEMEEDPSWKQLIPYVAIHHVGANGQVSVLTYQRGGAGGEARLHAKRSLGVGGHINPEDGLSGQIAYTAGMLRELREEIVLHGQYVEKPIGVIYDPQDEVGRVHLGIVHLLLVDSPLVYPRESCMQDLGFQWIERVGGQVLAYEGWSQFLIWELYGRDGLREELEAMRTAKV